MHAQAVLITEDGNGVQGKLVSLEFSSAWWSIGHLEGHVQFGKSTRSSRLACPTNKVEPGNGKLVRTRMAACYVSPDTMVAGGPGYLRISPRLATARGGEVSAHVVRRELLGDQ